MFDTELMRCIGEPNSVQYSQVSVCFKKKPTKKINFGEKP